jgi:hypothetical protein
MDYNHYGFGNQSPEVPGHCSVALDCWVPPLRNLLAIQLNQLEMVRHFLKSGIGYGEKLMKHLF